MHAGLLEHKPDGDMSERYPTHAQPEFKIDLGTIGAISASYHYQDRLLTARDPLILPGAFLKWYDLRPSDELVPESLMSEAQTLVTDEIANGQISVDYGVGFVVLHYEAQQTSLIVGSWHENQEFQETVYMRDRSTCPRFERTEAHFDGPADVWELAPLRHERLAWSRYLFSSRHNDVEASYLSEFLSSAV